LNSIKQTAEELSIQHRKMELQYSEDDDKKDFSVSLNYGEILYSVPTSLSASEQKKCAIDFNKASKGLRLSGTDLGNLVRYLVSYLNVVKAKQKSDPKLVTYHLDHNQISLNKYFSISQLAKTELPSKNEIVKTRNFLNEKIQEKIKVRESLNGVWIEPLGLLKQIVSLHKLENIEKLDLYLRGDGRPMGKSSSVLITLSIIQEGKAMQNLDYIYPLGIFVCGENYDELEIETKELRAKLHELYKKKWLDGSGNEHSSNHFLGGDYKFLRVISGQQSCGSNSFCLYCNITREQSKTDFKKLWKIDPDRFKTINSNGQKHEPLFPWVQPNNYLLDILHWYLRTQDDILYRTINDFWNVLGQNTDAIKTMNTKFYLYCKVNISFFKRGQNMEKIV